MLNQSLSFQGRKNSLMAAPNDLPQQQDDIRHFQHPHKYWPLITVLGVTIIVLVLYVDFANSPAESFLQKFRNAASGQTNTYGAHLFSVGRHHDLMAQVFETVEANKTLDPGGGARKANGTAGSNIFGSPNVDQGSHLRGSNMTTKDEKSNNISKSLHLQSQFINLQDEVYLNRTRFMKTYEAMEKKLKIYVYEDGYKPLVHEAKTQGIYATEGLFLKRIEEPGNQFTVVDPSKAHMFFLPFSIRQVVDHLQDPHTGSRRALKTFVTNYVEKIAQEYPYWNRTRGADHFFVSCHDWAPLLTQDHVELHQIAMKVVCNADLTRNFDYSKDVSISQTLTDGNQSDAEAGNLGPGDRDFLAFYAGQRHGPLRPILTDHWKDKDPAMKVYEVLPPSIAVNISYAQHMKRSKFCLCPRGYEVNSPRIVEAILSECVPVIVSDHFVLPFSDVLDWSKFSITVPEKDIPNLKKILTSVTDDKYRIMQRRLRYVRRHFVWLEETEDTRYDSFHMILYSIWKQSKKIHKRMLKSSSRHK